MAWCPIRSQLPVALLRIVSHEKEILEMLNRTNAIVGRGKQWIEEQTVYAICVCQKPHIGILYLHKALI